jgi:hypothetical protein
MNTDFIERYRFSVEAIFQVLGGNRKFNRNDLSEIKQLFKEDRVEEMLTRFAPDIDQSKV